MLIAVLSFSVLVFVVAVLWAANQRNISAFLHARTEERRQLRRRRYHEARNRASGGGRETPPG